jgi:hypothetical protein
VHVQDCWRSNPGDRPTFGQIVERIGRQVPDAAPREVQEVDD